MGTMAVKRKANSFDTLPPVCGGAIVTSVVMYPVDVVRAICMANPGTGAGAALKGFVDTHGVMGFVKQGLAAEVTRASLSRSIKFFMQPIVHRSLYGKPETQGTPISKGLAGAISTVPEVIAISPLENIKLAAQLDKDGRLPLHCAEEGFGRDVRRRHSPPGRDGALEPRPLLRHRRRDHGCQGHHRIVRWRRTQDDPSWRQRCHLSGLDASLQDHVVRRHGHRVIAARFHTTSSD